MMSISEKLECQKTVKINGVRFRIRKLSPANFLDKDYLLPMTHLAEKTSKEDRKPSEREMLKSVEEFKEKMLDTIEKAVIWAKLTIFSKRVDLKAFFDTIKENPELYSQLFTEIVNHSLGVKKKSFKPAS